MPDELREVVAGVCPLPASDAATAAAAATGASSATGSSAGASSGASSTSTSKSETTSSPPSTSAAGRTSAWSAAAVSGGSVLWISRAFSALIAFSINPIEAAQLPSYWTKRTLLPLSISLETWRIHLSSMPMSWKRLRRLWSSPPAAPAATAPAGPATSAPTTTPIAAPWTPPFMAPMSLDWWTLTRPVIFVRSAIAESTTFTLSSTASTFWIASRSRFAPASFSSANAARVWACCCSTAMGLASSVHVERLDEDAHRDPIARPWAESAGVCNRRLRSRGARGSAWSRHGAPMVRHSPAGSRTPSPTAPDEMAATFARPIRSQCRKPDATRARSRLGSVSARHLDT